ncbi:hypothetical protein BH09PAT2_BH09PAT2_08030 [soil metagenome]
MVSPEVTTYVTNLRKKDVPDSKILEKLLASGWAKTAALEILQSISNDDLPSAPPPPIATDVAMKPPQTKSMWDAFEHILLFISLYVLAVSITLSLLMFVAKWYPNIDESIAYYSSNSTSIWQKSLLRGYVSAIIVSYPIFSFFFYRVTKRTLKVPLLRTLKARRTLIYLTLVITFIIMLAYIIGTIFSLLNGNLTLNFIMQLVVVLSVSGSIFAYYLYQVKEDRHYD